MIDASDAVTDAGVLVIPQRLVTGRDGFALARELRAQFSGHPGAAPLVVVADPDGHIICDCIPYVQTGECRHWTTV